MRFPIGPVAQNGRKRPCGAPVVVPGTGGESGGTVFQHPAQVFGFELMRLADSESLGDERLHPGGALDMRLDSARCSRLRASQQNGDLHQRPPMYDDTTSSRPCPSSCAMTARATASLWHCSALGRLPVTTGAALPVNARYRSQA